MTHDLRAIRLAKGIGLRAAARQIGISPTYLHHIETGRCSLPKTENAKYEEFYGVQFPRSDEYNLGFANGIAHLTSDPRFLKLWAFAFAAAGEGIQIGGIDAAELCIQIADESGSDNRVETMEAWNAMAKELAL